MSPLRNKTRCAVPVCPVAAALLALAWVLAASTAPRAAPDAVSVVDHPPATERTSLYTARRPPLRATPFVRLPPGTIRPQGWLLRQLEMQAEGFHGHLQEISRFLEEEGNAWLDPGGEGQHGWEEPVYWLKGYSNLGYVLGDEEIIEETKRWIEAILRSQKEDGWFGPDRGRGGVATRLEGRADLWPNMIALFCLQGWYSYSGDERVLELMERYFRYLQEVPEERFLVGYWPRMRGGDLLWSVYWLYDRTGDAWLLDLAKKVHRRTADWESGVINWHNVNISQGFGEPATFWLQSGEERHLEAAYSNWATVRERYGQVPGGMFGGDENCRPGYTGPRQAIETCGIVEFMLSAETLVTITGDLLWADRCEDVAFNSLPAALTPELNGLRYLTAPNQVLSDGESKSPGIQNSGPMYLYSPHLHRCCQHNWGHGWPYFAQHLVLATSDEGLAVVFPCDSRTTAEVAGGEEVTLDVDTRYPFDESVRCTVRTGEPVRFPLYLRIPDWCQEARVRLGDGVLDVSPEPRRFVRIERRWKDGDTLRLEFSMQVSLRRWEDNMRSVSVDRGPLTYSLEIGEDWERAGGTDRFPAWEVRPATPWNYGLVLDEDDPAASFEVVHGEWPGDDRPFTHEGTPVRLRAKGRRIPEWTLDFRGLVRELQPSPVRSEEPVEAITLIPMGAARLRVSAFPVIGDGPGAHTWEPPPEPAFEASASHCFDGDTVRAVADGVEPGSSGDGSIPRMTWWPRRGTTEWLQASFEEPREVSSVAVYWFDDRDRGGCRVPLSWRLLARRDGAWYPVEGVEAYGTVRDQWNRVRFQPVTTGALRIEAVLRPGFSGGVLEWKVE